MDSELEHLKQLLALGWEIFDIEDHTGGKKIIRLRSNTHEEDTESIITTDPDTIETAFNNFAG